jgi:glyoxylase-like metal-dependent hydrolase (beta-lactamase superfamily II)
MKISDHCYIVTGLGVEPPWAVNSGFVVGEYTTLIIDTGSNYLSAQTIHGYAHCASPKNELIVVNTEPHFDHIGGNCFFHEKGIQIFAHPQSRRSYDEFEQNKKEFNDTIPNVVRKINNEAEVFFYKTQLVNPTRPVSPNEKFDLGGVVVSVHETPGHTPFNISLFVSKDRVLFCGDAIVTGYLPNLEAGNVSLWQTWLQSLDAIEDLSPDVIITGHGYSIEGAGNIVIEMNKIRTILKNAILRNVAPTCAK